MPYPPYHFGPNGFIAIVLRRWIDMPVFILASVIIDFEVLLTHSHKYAHTLLLGAVVGLAWGIAAYPLRKVFKRVMNLIMLPYETTRKRMIISGILGVWCHVILDAFYHYDVRLLWPYRKFILSKAITHPWSRAGIIATKHRIELICIILLTLTAVIYIISAIFYKRKRRQK